MYLAPRDAAGLPGPAARQHAAAALPHIAGRYQPASWRSRLFGLGGTLGTCLTILAALLVTWRVVSISVAKPPAPLLVELLPLSAPPEPPRALPEGPQQVEQKPQLRREVQLDRPEMPPVPAPDSVPTSPAPVEPSVAAEAVPETSAPKSIPAPPARRASSDAAVTWEAILLTHLEKHRRYPASARARGEQGVAHVRFRMNRQGSVLEARIERSSGSSSLDHAALETIRRAQPLPAIPDDRPSELELAVPVEFFVR